MPKEPVVGRVTGVGAAPCAVELDDVAELFTTPLFTVGAVVATVGAGVAIVAAIVGAGVAEGSTSG